MSRPGVAAALALALAGRTAGAGATSPAPGGAPEVGRPADGRYRAALELVYDGAFHEAETRLAALSGEHPQDPIGPYLQALALEWRLEQDPGSRALDDDVLALADLALARADEGLRGDAGDARALMARGAAHGVKSRLHLFRWQRGDAAREAVHMRRELRAARSVGVTVADLDFGLGLYDYYAETLPRFFKLLRVLAGIPGGDRERGLDSIARVARGGSLFHDGEARVQMFEIQSYFERNPDGALHWIREMWRRYPGWPLWGLKLSQLLRDLGLFGESADVAREILTTAQERRHANYQPVVALMARVSLGEALLLDLRFAAARAAAGPAEGGVEDAAWVGPRASLVVARSLEFQGDRQGAILHYRRAASGSDQRTAALARQALARPLTPAERRAADRLAAARRLSEAGRSADAQAQCLEALRAHPASAEARVCVAERSLGRGDPAAARALARGVAEDDGEPPWIRSRARFALAQALEREDQREAALRLYNQVWEKPSGRDAHRDAAARAIRRLAPATPLPDRPRWTQ